MRPRSGASLVIVLSVCALLSLCMGYMLLQAQWAHGSAVAEERRFQSRMLLSALVLEGRTWLEGEFAAGRLSGGGDRPSPAKFSEVMLHSMERNGAVLRVYDLNYGIGRVSASGYLRSQGTGRFFPPRENMFLLRAFKVGEEGGGVMLEAVYEAVPPDGAGRGWRIEDRPVLWWEVWP